MLFIDYPKLRQVRGRYYYTAHLVSDTSEAELHAFVAGLGVSPRAFDNKPKHPHYDLMEGMIKRAIAAGARQVASREIIEIMRKRGLGH